VVSTLNAADFGGVDVCGVLCSQRSIVSSAQLLTKRKWDDELGPLW